MILGSLIDAGVSLESVRSALGSLAIEPDVVWTQRVTRAGLSATKFCVRGEDLPDHAHDHRGHDHDHDRDHDEHHDGQDDELDHVRYGRPTHGETVHHHHGAHRTLAEIYGLIDRSALTAAGKDR